MSTTNAVEYSPRDLVGYGSNPPSAEWPNGAKIAISVVLNYEEGSEITPENGDLLSETHTSELGPGVKPMPPGQRDVNIESLYEYGSRAGVWRILRLFDEYGIHCTSYAVGQALELNPSVSVAFDKGGHEIASHGWRWVDRSVWSEQEEIDNVRKTIQAIESTSPSGRPPRGWYYGMVDTPASTRSRALVAQVFREEGIPLLYYSDDYSDDLPHWIPMPGGEKHEGLLLVPYSLDNNDFKFSAHNGFVTADDFASYLIDAFNELYAEGLKGSAKMMSIGLHCRIIGRPGRIAGLRKFFEHAKSKEGVWFATREEIALHWRQKFPYKP